MKNRNCPHCGGAYRMIEVKGQPVIYCDCCHTYINFHTQTYNYNVDKAPQYIRDSFDTVSLILKNPYAIVLAKAQLFSTAFSKDNVVVCDPMSGKFIAYATIKQLMLDNYTLIGMKGAFAYGAMDIVREAWMTNAAINPFKFPSDISVNQALFLPIITKVTNQNNTEMSKYDHAIDQFFRITLEGKLRVTFDVFRDGNLSPLRDEYLLLSNAVLDPYTVIGVCKSTDEVEEKVKNFIRSYTAVSNVRTETVYTPFPDKKGLDEYSDVYLHAMPSVAINGYGDRDVVNFDIYEHCEYKFEHKHGDIMKATAVIGYLKLLECLCRHYMGGELKNYGIERKRAYLSSCGILTVSDPKDVVMQFWKEVNDRINGSEASNYEHKK